MKQKSTSQSAFFHLRLVAGLFVFLSGVFLALVGGGAFSSALAQPKTSARAAAAEAVGQDEKLSPADKDGRFVYMIEFAEAGLLHRQGRASGESFNVNSPETKAQQTQLVAEQAAHVQAIDRALGRDLKATHYFLVTHSGLAARLTPREAQIVGALSGVKSIERERLYDLDTYRGPTLIGAPSIWNGTAVPGGVGTKGEGIVIGVLDGGLDPAHPSYANVASCGHGVGGAPNKLITFLDCATATGPGGLCNGPNPIDADGHGTHTSSTAGGNQLDGTAVPPPMPPAPYTEISGVAPCANLRTYKVCPTTSCPAADIQAGMNSVLLHGDVKVMNFSISGGTSPWTDNDRKKLDLVDAGVVVAASAGNTSTTIPNPVGNVGHRGPWVMTVAASTHDGQKEGKLSAAGPGTPPAGTQNIILVRGNASPEGSPLANYPIRHYAAQPATAEGCTATVPAFPAGYFTGSVALIHRGTCGFAEKINNAFNAGATMVFIRNNQAGSLSMDTTAAPGLLAYSMDQTPGNALVAFVDANPATATINFDLVPTPADILANFSLRGPIAGTLQNLTKPDITAPGVNIYAAQPLGPFPSGYGFLSGTSMSSPHAAGAAALVRAARPTWSAPEVKSALMMTSFKGGTKEDRVTPWNPDDVGNGRVDLTKAARAGLVMHESFANFLAANPATGGDPKTLNIPSVRNMNCAPNCTWTRTVRNTITANSSWSASGAAITPGFNISVQPANFSFTGSVGETQQLTITATPTTPLLSAVAFGEVVLTQTAGPSADGPGSSPSEHITVAIKGEPMVVSAVSRKNHGGTDFDIPLPLTGTPGVECRTGPVAGEHQIVVTLTGPATVGGASVSSGIGSASASAVGSVITVNLTGVTDIQNLVVTLTNASNGSSTATFAIPMGVLAGDTNGNRSVNVGDVAQTKGQSGVAVGPGNFRNDVNANGAINVGDIASVKAKSGSSLP